MAQINQDPIILAQDQQFGDENEPMRSGPALPLAQDDIDELLYGEELPAGQRLTELRQLREQLYGSDAADVGERDSKLLLGEVDRAIAELESPGEGMDPTSVDHNPEDHRETLSPDDDLLLDAQEEDDESEADLFGEDLDDDDVLDAEEWEDGDTFDPAKGVH